MKSILLAALLASPGIVESVRQAQIPEPLAGFAGVFQESYKPRTADELRVRLDDGRLIQVRPRETQIFAPGARVLIVPDGKGVRVEHAEEPSSF